MFFWKVTFEGITNVFLYSGTLNKIGYNNGRCTRRYTGLYEVFRYYVSVWKMLHRISRQIVFENLSVK
jgi:hypothetical protein